MSAWFTAIMETYDPEALRDEIFRQQAAKETFRNRLADEEKRRLDAERRMHNAELLLWFAVFFTFWGGVSFGALISRAFK